MTQVRSFRGIVLPEPGTLVGYAEVMCMFNLPVPVPEQIAIIGVNNRVYTTDTVKVFSPRYQPGADPYSQLVFALKYEGVNLLLLKKLFEHFQDDEIIHILKKEPTGRYSRSIWFLYEWLMERQLPIPDADIKRKYSALLDNRLQFSSEGIKSPRHRIINNLPGTQAFCPLIRKTEKLQAYIEADLATTAQARLGEFHKDLLHRTSAFLLLKDSKASFTIEGESPKSKRLARWAMAIGQAGTIPLSKEELLRLQEIVLENGRFTRLGFRTEGGFVGEHDRMTFEPVPDHISARWQDLDQLIEGLLDTCRLLQRAPFDPVLTAAMISFGFVFIHPFSDGNGRIHRYLIHHVLATKQFSPQGMIFPVSASMLENIVTYREILEAYSQPLMQFIEWHATPDRNIEVTNETIDYYRYFDATKQAEFLYDCVNDTITRIIPEEITYLIRYDAFRQYLEDVFDMPDKLVSLLAGFLRQNNGILSQRARSKEFAALGDHEVVTIQNKYREIFTENS